MSASDIFVAYQNEIDQAANAVDMVSEAYLKNMSSGGNHQALIIKRERELTEQMSLLAFYVQVLSKGRDSIIQAAGFEIIEDAISDEKEEF